MSDLILVFSLPDFGQSLEELMGKLVLIGKQMIMNYGVPMFQFQPVLTVPLDVIHHHHQIKPTSIS